jgi:hypothetical protein
VLAAPAALNDPQLLARQTAVNLGLARTGQNILMIAGLETTEIEVAPSITVLGV